MRWKCPTKTRGVQASSGHYIGCYKGVGEKSPGDGSVGSQAGPFPGLHQSGTGAIKKVKEIHQLPLWVVHGMPSDVVLVPPHSSSPLLPAGALVSFFLILIVYLLAFLPINGKLSLA